MLKYAQAVPIKFLGIRLSCARDRRAPQGICADAVEQPGRDQRQAEADRTDRAAMVCRRPRQRRRRLLQRSAGAASVQMARAQGRKPRSQFPRRICRRPQCRDRRDLRFLRSVHVGSLSPGHPQSPVLPPHRRAAKGRRRRRDQHQRNHRCFRVRALARRQQLPAPKLQSWATSKQADPGKIMGSVRTDDAGMLVAD